MILDSILETPIKNISLEGGNVKHALKSSEKSYNGFGEAYFSFLNKGAVKAWKLHTRMTMNLIVPVGNVKFVFFDPNKDKFLDKTIGEICYSRLTVPPGIWFGFKSESESQSLILNIANILHDPEEVKKKAIDEINYNW